MSSRAGESNLSQKAKNKVKPGIEPGSYPCEGYVLTIIRFDRCISLVWLIFYYITSEGAEGIKLPIQQIQAANV